MKKQSAAFLLCSFLLYGYAPAQNIGPSTLNACGGSVVSGGNTYEWSVAEMTLVSTFENGNIRVTQGILQPAQQTADIKENNPPFFNSFLVYPVPTGDLLYLKPDFGTSGKLDWTLLDIQGRQIRSHSAQLNQGNEIQSLDLSALPAANYFLRIRFKSSQGTTSASYTVQKTL